MDNQLMSATPTISLWCMRSRLNDKKLEDGSAITMDGRNAQLIMAFNKLVDEMSDCSIYDWTENHTSEDGRFEIADNKYQLSTSCYFMDKAELKSVTLKLLLDDITLEPTAISIILGGQETDEHRNTLIRTLAIFDAAQCENAEDMATLINDTIRAKLLDDGYRDITEIRIKPSTIDTKWIESAYVFSREGSAKDVKVVGFNADGAKSMMLLSYKINGEKQSSQTSIAHYIYGYGIGQEEAVAH